MKKIGIYQNGGAIIVDDEQPVSALLNGKQPDSFVAYTEENLQKYFNIAPAPQKPQG